MREQPLPQAPCSASVKPALSWGGRHLEKQGRVVPLWGQVKLRGNYPDDLSLGSQAPDTRIRRFGLALAQRPREGRTPGTALQVGGSWPAHSCFWSVPGGSSMESICFVSFGVYVYWRTSFWE